MYADDFDKNTYKIQLQNLKTGKKITDFIFSPEKITMYRIFLKT